MSKLVEKLNKSFSMYERYSYVVLHPETKEELVTVYFKSPSVSSAVKELNKFQGKEFKDVPDAILLLVERALDENGKAAFGPEDYAGLLEMPLDVIMDMYNFSGNPSKTTVESLKK
jgi:hypothetical protein